MSQETSLLIIWVCSWITVILSCASMAVALWAVWRYR